MYEDIGKANSILISTFLNIGIYQFYKYETTLLSAIFKILDQSPHSRIPASTHINVDW